MAETTPGAHAYTAYCRVLCGAQCTLVPPYDALADQLREAWEAAAEAVLDAWQAQPRMETPVQSRRWTPQPLHTEDHSDA